MLHKQKWVSFIPAFWAGLIGAISFLESWLKFRAAGVTLPVGLSIGKLVFTAVNRIEILLLVSLWILIFFHSSGRKTLLDSKHREIWALSTILALQTLWLLPQLSSRVDLILAGQTPANSYLHVGFIVFECFKMLLLLRISFRYKIV